MRPIPDPLYQFLSVLENQRCPDCWGYTAAAARLGVGEPGQFCSCPFDEEHP